MGSSSCKTRALRLAFSKYFVLVSEIKNEDDVVTFEEEEDDDDVVDESVAYCLRKVVVRLRTACSLYELGRR